MRMMLCVILCLVRGDFMGLFFFKSFKKKHRFSLSGHFTQRTKVSPFLKKNNNIGSKILKPANFPQKNMDGSQSMTSDSDFKVTFYSSIIWRYYGKATAVMNEK